jgi:sRNA-binding protein
LRQLSKCFALREPQRRPLKIGIFEDILTALPGVISKTKLKAALWWHAVVVPNFQVIVSPTAKPNS